MVKKYEIKNQILKYFIKYYWFLESDSEITINNKLLPVNNIDLLINCSEPVTYEKNGIDTVSENVHFGSLRNEPEVIKQSGKLKVFGISFYPHGIYPLLQVPLQEFAGRVTGLKNILPRLSELAETVLSDESLTLEERIEILEDIILEEGNYNCFDMKIIKIFNSFYSEHFNNNINIKEFCSNYGLNTKYLERLFLKYTGVGPKVFGRIGRFQKSVREMIYCQNYKNLTELAYEGDYYDQTHFIKEFKKFSGMTPSEFIKTGNSVKHILTER
jgi:AraC-like DNA-binding protein